MATKVGKIKFENVAGNYGFMIAWLENNVEPANKYSKDMVAMPYYGSAISQFARYAGVNGNWHLEIRGMKLFITVEIANPKLAIKFGLEHSYAQ